MFVKSNKNDGANGVYYTHHIVESYRNEDGELRLPVSGQYYGPAG
ncbi:MAG: hypothetical protein ACLFVT_08920 [Syntrophobacteria bacterium]